MTDLAIANVALVSEHASPVAAPGGQESGGQNVYVAALANEFGRRGIEVVIYTRRDNMNLPRRLRLAPHVVLEHIDAGPPTRLPRDELLPLMRQFGEQLESAWRRNRPDVVHAHYWMSGLAALQAGVRLHIPVVQTFHALGITKRRNQHQSWHDTSLSVRIRAEATVGSAVDAIAATSSEELLELVQSGARPRLAEVIPCGVDTTLFRPSTCFQSTSGHPDSPGRIVVVGRLVKRKGVDDVVRSMPLLRGVKLVIAGGSGWSGDANAGRVSRLALQLGVADRIDFIGPVEHTTVPVLLHSADAAVCVPWYEPFGMAALEAMACSVPVVATAVGGLRETIIDGQTGLHVPPRDPESLATALRKLLNNRALRESLGANGAKRAANLYAWSKVADSLVCLYARSIETRCREDRTCGSC